MRRLALCLVLGGACFRLPVAAQTVDFQGRPAVVVANDKLQLTVAVNGAAMLNLAMADDPAHFSPLWRNLGHFLCLDGFGAPSKEEAAAGLPNHGEANRQKFEILSSTKDGALHSVKMAARLPLAQEAVTRTIEMVDGESVAYVETEVESLVAFDRPISWAEHATVGPPFLEPGQVTIDMPAAHCRVRPFKPGDIPPRLPYDRDFDWPNAPLLAGGTTDLRDIPATKSLDLASCQMDTARQFGYVAAVHRGRKLLFGYVFRREDFPWLMSWMNYTGTERAARGVEFSTQPFDISHRETVESHQMFGTPAFRWLPGKSKIRARYMMFYTHVPDGFSGVADVVFENGRITVKDRAGHEVSLAASR